MLYLSILITFILHINVYVAIFCTIFVDCSPKQSNKRPFGLLSKLSPSQTSPLYGIPMDSIIFRWKWEYPSLKFWIRPGLIITFDKLQLSFEIKTNLSLYWQEVGETRICYIWDGCMSQVKGQLQSFAGWLAGAGY